VALCDWLEERRTELAGRLGADLPPPAVTRQRPSAATFPGERFRRDGETVTAAAIRLAPALRASYLPIQGPPGTGRHTPQQILELTSQGRAVGITATSHAVIYNLIEAVCKEAADRGMTLRIGQRPDEGNSCLHPAAATMTLTSGTGSGRSRTGCGGWNHLAVVT